VRLVPIARAGRIGTLYEGSGDGGAERRIRRVGEKRKLPARIGVAVLLMPARFSFGTVGAQVLDHAGQAETGTDEKRPKGDGGEEESMHDD